MKNSGVMLERNPETGEVWVNAGPMSGADARRLGNILGVFVRTRRGGLWIALLSLASERLRRGNEPGATILRLDEGAGDPETRGADWSTRTELADRRRAG